MKRFSTLFISLMLFGSVGLAGSVPEITHQDINMTDGKLSAVDFDIKQQKEVASCMQRLAQLTEACHTSTETARNDCDDSQNTGLAQAQQAAVVLGQQVSSSVQAACSTMGKISQAANAATAAYQINCQSSVGNCTASCQSAVEYSKQTQNCSAAMLASGRPQSADAQATATADLRDTQKTCVGFQKKADTAQIAVNNFLATTMQAQNCATESDGTSTVLPEICKTNPTLPGCVATGPVDCSKPEMASNKVCVCSKNPNDPSCMSGQNSNSSNTPNSGGVTGVRTSSSAGDGFGGDNFGLPEISQGRVSSGSDTGIDGKQGSGANLGSSGGGGGGGAGDHGGKGGTDDPVGVNAGFYGGGGGGSSGGGGGYGGGSGGGYGGQGAGGYAGAKGAGGPNLRQFLPGGQLDPKARGVAGVSGPDGITGPHSNIWQKIQNRYQVVSPSLMP